MDPKTKTEATGLAAGLGAKLITFIMCVMPPVIVANIIHWSASIIAESKISLRARFAIVCGSFGLSSFVHWVCVATSFKYEWILIASTSMATPQILKFIHQEFGDMMKAWLRNQLSFFMKEKEKR